MEKERRVARTELDFFPAGIAEHWGKKRVELSLVHGTWQLRPGYADQGIKPYLEKMAFFFQSFALTN